MVLYYAAKQHYKRRQRCSSSMEQRGAAWQRWTESKHSLGDVYRWCISILTLIHSADSEPPIWLLLQHTYVSIAYVNKLLIFWNQEEILIIIIIIIIIIITYLHNKINMNVLWIRNSWTLLHLRRVDAACALTRWQHFCERNDVMAAISKVWHHIWNPTPAIDTNLHRPSATILRNFIPIRFETIEP